MRQVVSSIRNRCVGVTTGAGLIILLLGGGAVTGCCVPAKPNAVFSRDSAPDLHSHAQPNRVRVRHVSLDLGLDFTARTAAGTVVLTFDRPDAQAPLTLDLKGPVVTAITGADGKARRFRLGPEDPQLGTALIVDLEPADRSVKIAYHTTDRSVALQWLGSEQTRDRKHPFVFTQGEAIFTRTWIPLQDSPGVRVTYDARIQAPKDLTVLMGAEQLGRGPDGAWRFRLDKPVAPYLIALACGDLAFAPVSARSGIWAEPSLVRASQAELSDTESMIAAAEALFGPYRWGRYDVLILPPAFPFGGMENPLLTFATPTILAGDKSLVALVAHELAHSWSGNLVTNATWRDFWLNEGFTVYFENRIMERVYGADRAVLERQLSWNQLAKEMRELQPWQQVLHLELKGRHPDDGFSIVPYEKGALFLRRLEELFGRPRFDVFLRGYFDHYAFQSITTAEFVAFLKANLFPLDAAAAAKLDLAAWIEKPGLPTDAPKAVSGALTKVDKERQRWLLGSGARDLATTGWVTQQWQYFIQGMPSFLSDVQMADLDSKFHFSASANSEILCDWLVLAVRLQYHAADEPLTKFLMAVGRRKFLKPIYSELAKTEGGLLRARAIYAKARPGYHAVSTGTIDKILKWSL